MDNEAKPVAGADRAETIARMLAERLKKTREDVLASIGSRPFKGVPITESERVERYRVMREDPAAWTQLFAENMTQDKDGKPLIRRGLLAELAKLEASQPPSAPWDEGGPV